jgi:hypothetical protein
LLLGVEASTFFLNNRLTDGGEFVRFTRRPSFTPRKIPATHFRYRLRRPQRHSATGRIRKIEKLNYLIMKRTGDLPACSRVPQPTTLQRGPRSITCLVGNPYRTIFWQRLSGGTLVCLELTSEIPGHSQDMKPLPAVMVHPAGRCIFQSILQSTPSDRSQIHSVVFIIRVRG